MYPVTYEADYQAEQNRATTFFRIILAIPWIIVAYVYEIAAFFTQLFAWVALVITGRYPEGLYKLNSGFVRYRVRTAAWITLQTDEWPPFGIADDPAYPIRVEFAPREEKQSRLKVFFRIILAIPMLILTYAVGYVHQLPRRARLADDRLPRLPARGRQQRDDLLQQLLRSALRLPGAADRRLSAGRDRERQGRRPERGPGRAADAAEPLRQVRQGKGRAGR